MAIYELTFGIYVDAESPEDAMNKVGPVVTLLNELDIENDAAIEGPDIPAL